MTKVSLVTRRKDRVFDAPTRASERARQRALDKTGLDTAPAKQVLEKSESDVSVSLQEGTPTVEVKIPADRRFDLDEVSGAILREKSSTQTLAEISKEKIGDKWELKVQFLPENAQKMLTAKQLARILSVSTETVYSLRKKGVIKGYQVGTTWRFVWSEVLDALSKNKGKA